jgi:pyruvate dehydrogenase E1 component beta subunit
MWCGSPDPYANHLEEAAIPQVNDIINTVKKIIHHD